MSVFIRINPDEFPEMKRFKSTIGPFPGGVVVERRIAQFHRIGTTIGMMTAPLRFWSKYRRTLSPDLKEQVLLRNFMRDHIAFGSAIGFVSGAVVGTIEGCLNYPTPKELVTTAVALRQDKEHDRWMKTWARCSVIGLTYGVLFVERTSMIYRLGLGSGVGCMAGWGLSYSYFDLAVSLLN